MTRIDATIGAGPADTLVAEAQRLEALGVGTIWAAQLHQTPFVPLAAIAAATTRAHLGTAIALAFTRSPMETALTALDMDRLTQGRFKLGLGAGAKRLNEQWHEVADFGRPAPHLKETVEVVRLLVEQGARGEPVHYRGRYHQLDLRGWRPRFAPERPSIPIYVAGLGEAMARIAGDVADGLLGHRLWSLRWLHEVIAPNVEVGLRRAGRERAAFDLSAAVAVHADDDPAQARLAAARDIASYAASATYRELFTWHGFGDDAARAREAFRAGDVDAALPHITDAMIDTFAVAGTPAECRAGLQPWLASADSLRLDLSGHAGAAIARTLVEGGPAPKPPTR